MSRTRADDVRPLRSEHLEAPTSGLPDARIEMTRSRTSSFLAGMAAVPLVALAVAGCGGDDSGDASAATPPETPSGKTATVGVTNTNLGDVLVNSRGSPSTSSRRTRAPTARASASARTSGPRSERAESPRSAQGSTPRRSERRPAPTASRSSPTTVTRCTSTTATVSPATPTVRVRIRSAPRGSRYRPPASRCPASRRAVAGLRARVRCCSRGGLQHPRVSQRPFVAAIRPHGRDRRGGARPREAPRRPDPRDRALRGDARGRGGRLPARSRDPAHEGLDDARRSSSRGSRRSSSALFAYHWASRVSDTTSWRVCQTSRPGPPGNQARHYPRRKAMPTVRWSAPGLHTRGDPTGRHRPRHPARLLGGSARRELESGRGPALRHVHARPPAGLVALPRGLDVGERRAPGRGRPATFLAEGLFDFAAGHSRRSWPRSSGGWRFRQGSGGVSRRPCPRQR